MSRSGTGRTAFVLAGGGSLGAVQVGMLEALVERGVEPDLLVGASVGAINAAYFAGDPSLEGVRRLGDIWRGLERSDVFPLSLLGTVAGLLSWRAHLLSPGPLRRLITSNLPYERIEDAALPCHLVATDALDGEEVLLSSGPVIDSLMASAAIPAVFPPVELDGRHLLDGGIAHHTPLRAAVDLEADLIVVLPTGVPCAIEEPPNGVVEMALHGLNLMIHRQLLLEIEALGDTADLVVVPTLCPLPTSSYDFSRAAELIDRAARSTRQWLRGDGFDAGEIPDSLRPHAHPPT